MVSRLLSATPAAFARAAAPVRRRAGFTLVELLVSMVVGLLLIVFLFQLFNATVTAWRAGENQNDTYREARAALQMMERDISQTTAVLPRNAYPSPTPTPVPPATPAPPIVGALAAVLVLDRYPTPVPSPAPVSGDEINEELYCVTNIPNNGSSGLCAVGYFCVWMPDLIPPGDPRHATAPHAYALMRQYLGSGKPAVAADPANNVPATAAVPGLYDRIQAAAQTHPANAPFVLSFKDLYLRGPLPFVPDPTTVQAEATELCSYVWDLQFRTEERLTQPSATPPIMYTAQADPITGYQTNLPTFVEVRFKALSAGAARQLEGNAAITRQDWSSVNGGDANYQRFILPGTRQFVSRVPLYSGSIIPTPTP